MNAQQFLTWMRAPGKTSREESAQLDALLDAFPYFQSGHLLYIKNLHNQGSFLYNNQLKTAAAYAVNRKVLYNLITLKTEPIVVNVALDSPPAEEGLSLRRAGAQSDKPVSFEKEEQTETSIKFPPKKFTSDPDEWEAGMLRQLQLLHHWKKTEDDRRENVPGSQFKVSGSETTSTNANETENKSKSEVIQTPAAKDEINTLLYVLVEPGQPEDISIETPEEISNDVAEDAESTQWEITPAVEQHVEPVQEIVKPTDPVQQEILVEAIHSSLELEVDDKLPTAEELKPFRIETGDQKQEAEVVESSDKLASKTRSTEAEQSEEVVVAFENMSFSEWISEVNKKKAPAELPKTVLSEDKLIEQFIKEEPRIQVKKSGFFNPVNMAKKSVQDSDEFVTETLARIYAKQGNHSKAIRAYQKLSLKFPEKTAYFAALIEELKRTPNK